MEYSKQAMNQLQRQAPELGRYVAAFKDLTEELPENNGIQIGMFIIDMNNKYYYVPVIAKGDTVQPIESIFDSEAKVFIPLTKKLVEWLMEKDPFLGAGEKVPGHVARDPDLYDAIVPPKTGKYVYAGESRVHELAAQLPNELREGMAAMIQKCANHINSVMDVDVLVEAINRPKPEYHAPVGPMPEVVTQAGGLSEEQVQEVLSKGYTVKNAPKSTIVAVEAGGVDAFVQANSLQPGEAYNGLTMAGQDISVVCLKRLESNQDGDALLKNTHLGRGTRRPIGEGPLVVTTKGQMVRMSCSRKPVVYERPVSYESALEELGAKALVAVKQKDYGMFATPEGYAEAGTVAEVYKEGEWTCFKVLGHGGCTYFKTHPSIKRYCKTKGIHFIPEDATFVPLSGAPIEIMTDINKAQMVHEINEARALPYASTLQHRDGQYAVDGQIVGGKPQMIAHGLVTWSMDVPTVETFVKKAEEQGTVKIRMSKQANARTGSGGQDSRNAKPAPFPRYGNIPAPTSPSALGATHTAVRGKGQTEQLTGTAEDRAVGMLKDAAAKEMDAFFGMNKEAARGGGRPSTGGSATMRSPMVEYGEKLPNDKQITGTARQRNEGMPGKVENAAASADRQAMEATLITEMLHNPDMHGAIQEYLPDIKDAIDKLGRSLFLMRLNSAKLAEQIDADALNSLMTATRNTFRNLGENYVELQNLIAHEG